MISKETISNQLCRTFCASISVNPVPAGYAVSTSFEDQSGDRIGFYLVRQGEGYCIEDDGEYLARLIGSGIAIDEGQRARLLDSILQQSGAYWDKDTYEIRSEDFAEDEIGLQMTNFLTALIRIRDLELLTRDLVRSTFKEDVKAELVSRFGDSVSINERETFNGSLGHFVADLVIRSKYKQNRTGVLHCISSNAKLTEAELFFEDVQKAGRRDLSVIAVIEDPDMHVISKKNHERALKRSIPITTWRGNEVDACSKIGQEIGIPR